MRPLDSRPLPMLHSLPPSRFHSPTTPSLPPSPPLRPRHVPSPLLLSPTDSRPLPLPQSPPCPPPMAPNLGYDEHELRDDHDSAAYAHSCPPPLSPSSDGCFPPPLSPHYHHQGYTHAPNGPSYSWGMQDYFGHTPCTCQRPAPCCGVRSATMTMAMEGYSSPQSVYTPLPTPPAHTWLPPPVPQFSETVTEFAVPVALKDEGEVFRLINEFMFSKELFPFGINLSRQEETVDGEPEVHTFLQMITAEHWSGKFEAQVRQILSDAVDDDGVMISVRQVKD